MYSSNAAAVLVGQGYDPLDDFEATALPNGELSIDWHHTDPKPTPEQVDQWALEQQKPKLTEAAYLRCAELSESLVAGYSPAERSSWTEIAREAQACKDSGYVTIGPYMQEEISATPTLDAQTLADRVLGKAAAFRAALARYKGVRSVLVAEIEAMTDQQVMAVTVEQIKSDPRWSSGA